MCGLMLVMYDRDRHFVGPPTRFMSCKLKYCFTLPDWDYCIYLVRWSNYAFLIDIRFHISRCRWPDLVHTRYLAPIKRDSPFSRWVPNNQWISRVPSVQTCHSNARHGSIGETVTATDADVQLRSQHRNAYPRTQPAGGLWPE